jgi:hypothetical protein
VIEITVFEKSGGPLSKKIHLIDGRLANDDRACSMSRGMARRVRVDPANMAALAGLISNFTSREAYALGRLKDGLPDCVLVVTAAKIGEAQKTDPTTITRSLDYLAFAKGEPGIALIDVDRKGMPHAVKARVAGAEGVWGALCTVVPALKSVALVARDTQQGDRRNLPVKRRVSLRSRGCRLRRYSPLPVRSARSLVARRLRLGLGFRVRKLSRQKLG